jgi:hypothetical protein
MTMQRILSTLLLTMFAGIAAAAPDAALVEAGRAIYRDGRLPSGGAIEAKRAGSDSMEGAPAACANCHQRSGLGLSEGAVVTPPVSGPALFEKASATPAGRRAPGMEFRDYSFRTRPAYDDATLARAIREGVNPSGEKLKDLMPRYALADADMKALIAYLHTLSAQPSPGVDGARVKVATVITPDAPPAQRDEYLGVLRACAADHPEWHLHEWTLQGPSATWPGQLRERIAREPVFAVLSGIGGPDWAPVQRFCDGQSVPCLFPNVIVPGSRVPSWYTFYFFRGVELEATVFMSEIKRRHAERPVPRVMQVIGKGAAPRGGSMILDALYDAGIQLEETEKDVSKLDEDDVLILWLNPEELAALMKRVPTPPRGTLVLVSGLLAGLEDAPLTPAWKEAAQLSYPYDAAARWKLRMERNLQPWLAQHHLKPGDMRLQGNTLAACNVFSESLLRMNGTFMRDYLVETIENYPTAMGNAPAPEAFPRFSLGPGQRFSSKGAYLVRFVSPQDKRVAPVRDEWIVP